MIKTKSLVNYQVELSNGNHIITSDVGKNIGGDDSGLNPHELLEASLAACTSQTVTMYARRKRLPLTGMEVQVTIQSEDETNQILRDITYVGDLTQDQKDRLTEIANKCPMHKFLQKLTKIETRVS